LNIRNQIHFVTMAMCNLQVPDQGRLSQGPTQVACAIQRLRQGAGTAFAHAVHSMTRASSHWSLWLPATIPSNMVAGVQYGSNLGVSLLCAMLMSTTRHHTPLAASYPLVILWLNVFVRVVALVVMFNHVRELCCSNTNLALQGQHACHDCRQAGGHLMAGHLSQTPTFSQIHT
jgi:hypothetical protein